MLAVLISVALVGAEGAASTGVLAKASMHHGNPRGAMASFLERREEVSFADTVISRAVAESRDLQPNEAMEKVKNLISHMIEQKQQEHADLTDHETFCKKEMSESKVKLRKLQLDIDKHQADYDKLEAQLAEKKDNNGDTQAALTNSLQKSQQAAEKRDKEKKQYEAAREAASQKTAPPKEADFSWETPSTPEPEPQRESEADILKRIKAEQAEEDKAYKFKKEQEKAEVDRARLQKDIEYGQQDVTRMERELVEAEQDLGTLKSEMDATKEYDAQIHSQCVVPRESHEERQARRQDQIESLKNAYEMLGGEGERW